MRGVTLALMLALTAVLPIGALAQMRAVPIPGPLDPRVRTVMYQDDAVIALRGHYGYQIMLEFGADERIENVSIGDSLAWQVTPNRRADTLFLKPIEFDAATNMAVVTTKRRYSFELTATEATGLGDPDILFRVRIAFPPPPAPDPVSAAGEAPVIASGAAYSVSGSPRNVPSRVFDDGERTYFAWPEGASTPAVFALNADGSESVVNFTMRGGLMAVERIAPAFILRNGAEQTTVHNDGWREPPPGPGAPTARSEAKAESPGTPFRLFQRRAKGAADAPR